MEAPQPQKHVIEISWTALWRTFFFLVLAAILVFARNILLGLFMALVISSGLDAAVDFLERRKIPRPLGVVLIFLVAAVALAVLVSFVIPFMIEDLKALFADDNGIIGDFLGRLGGSDTAASVSEALGRLGSDFLAGGSSAAFFSDVLGGLGLAAAVLVTSFYLALSRDGVERFIRGVLPHGFGAKALRIYTRSRRKIGLWFQSQLLLSFIIGVLVWASLAALGVRHAFLLGVMAGVFELVPFVGPIISGAVALLVALTISPGIAFYTLLVFLLIQQLESHVLVPLLMRKTIDMHPVVVIIALLIGIEAGGLMGALVAVPVAAVIQEVLADRAA